MRARGACVQNFLGHLLDEMKDLMPPPPSTSSVAMALVDVAQWSSEESTELPSDTAMSDIIAVLSKRLAVDIVVKLPLVVVPVSSQSAVAVVVDLGGLSMANELRVVPAVTSADNLPAVTDWTNCHWSNVSISR